MLTTTVTLACGPVNSEHGSLTSFGRTNIENSLLKIFGCDLVASWDGTFFKKRPNFSDSSSSYIHLKLFSLAHLVESVRPTQDFFTAASNYDRWVKINSTYIDEPCNTSIYGNTNHSVMGWLIIVAS